MTASARGKRRTVRVTARPRKYSQVREGSTKVQFVCTDGEKRMAQLTAEREGVTMSALIRRALRYYCPVDIQQATVEAEQH